MMRVVVEGRNPELTPVSEVMTTNLATIQESAARSELSSTALALEQFDESLETGQAVLA